jgi:ATP-dependent helicase/nuclease subunit A
MYVNIVSSGAFVEKGCGTMTNKNIILDACNPKNSVVISACAGSGKTWILISRIFRLLLSGVAPKEILAITFTRKAAQEMRDRLRKILIEFTKFDDFHIRQELQNRGVADQDLEESIVKARGLFEQVLSDPNEISIDTFHGWFSKICRVSPLTSNLNHQGNLREDQYRLITEAMQTWWEKLGAGKVNSLIFKRIF